MNTVNWIGLATLVRKEIDRFMGVVIQTLVSPWVSAVLFIYIFGDIVGRQIDSIGGVSYIEFVLPGVLMMNVLTSAFMQTSSTLYFQRWARHIEEVLVAPLSHFEMILGYIAGGVSRGVIVGGGILVIGILFDAVTMSSFGMFLFYTLGASVVFSLLGILTGLWSSNFEHLSLIPTFVLMPLSFLGGMFNSVSMLPDNMQTFVLWNPFFYFVDGIRYSMTGISEANTVIGISMILGLIITLSIYTWWLFERGWRLRG